MTDGLDHLAHDHGELNRDVLALGAAVRVTQGSASGLAAQLCDLREGLFLHFAREEEGLFPFVAEAAPELELQVHAMETAHDTICGALARMVHLATSGASIDVVAPVFERFETAYAAHAKMESTLLATLATRLDADQRARLAAVVDGL
jgi:iron-sulfur cluster repair protein YtfE (RIC family)